MFKQFCIKKILGSMKIRRDISVQFVSAINGLNWCFLHYTITICGCRPLATTNCLRRRLCYTVCDSGLLLSWRATGNWQMMKDWRDALSELKLFSNHAECSAAPMIKHIVKLVAASCQDVVLHSAVRLRPRVRISRGYLYSMTAHQACI